MEIRRVQVQFILSLHRLAYRLPSWKPYRKHENHCLPLINENEVFVLPIGFVVKSMCTKLLFLQLLHLSHSCLHSAHRYIFDFCWLPQALALLGMPLIQNHKIKHLDGIEPDQDNEQSKTIRYS